MHWIDAGPNAEASEAKSEPLQQRPQEILTSRRTRYASLAARHSLYTVSQRKACIVLLCLHADDQNGEEHGEHKAELCHRTYRARLTSNAG